MEYVISAKRGNTNAMFLLKERSKIDPTTIVPYNVVTSFCNILSSCGTTGTGDWKMKMCSESDDGKTGSTRRTANISFICKSIPTGQVVGDRPDTFTFDLHNQTESNLATNFANAAAALGRSNEMLIQSAMIIIE